jgi:hypothetical protein
MATEPVFEVSADQHRHTHTAPNSHASNVENRHIAAEIVFEPVGSGVRVVARDSDQRLLWGYIGSEETTNQKHCMVATYETLQKVLTEELSKCHLNNFKPKDPLASAHAALDQLERTTRWLKQSLTVKTATEASSERAALIAGIASDADLQIHHVADGLRGMRNIGSLDGQTFVIAGKLSVPRDDMTKKIRQAGGAVADSIAEIVAKTVTGLLVGTDPDETILAQAQELGIRRFTEAELRTKLTGTPEKSTEVERSKTQQGELF